MIASIGDLIDVGRASRPTHDHRITIAGRTVTIRIRSTTPVEQATIDWESHLAYARKAKAAGLTVLDYQVDAITQARMLWRLCVCEPELTERDLDDVFATWSSEAVNDVTRILKVLGSLDLRPVYDAALASLDADAPEPDADE